jgi:HlyD family secretion protein
VSRLFPIPPRSRSDDSTSSDRRHQRVWTLRDGNPTSVEVTVGATDGRMTQVVSGALAPGAEVLTGVVQSAK